MAEFRMRPSTSAEKLYFYAQSQNISMKTGLIGHLRGDFGSSGDLFYSTFFDFRQSLKTDKFREEFDTVINALRENPEYGGILAGRSQMASYCNRTATEENILSTYPHYGYRVDTDEYAYLIRCFPLKGDYNFYCFCYLKNWLDSHLAAAQKGIRFIDSKYNEKFRIEDGAKVRWILSDGSLRDAIVRYFDDYHMEIQSERGNTVYHICEFAEQFEQNGCKDIFPMPKSNEGMTREEFIALIGKDIVVDYRFGTELQRWSMKNFYVDEQGRIRHKRITEMLTDGFVAKARNPHWGEATHG